MSIFARLFAAERGSIMVLAALSLTAVMGMSGLAVEVGTGYAAKTRNQRVADMAALGAALAYQANSSPNEAAQTAKDIVAIRDNCGCSNSGQIARLLDLKPGIAGSS